MIYKTIYKNQMTHAVAGGLLLGMSSFGIEANTNSVMGNIESSSNAFMNAIKNSGIRFGGWVHGGATFNPYQTDGFNGPVTFADQANRVQMNQLKCALEVILNMSVKFLILENQRSLDSIKLKLIKLMV